MIDVLENGLADRAREARNEMDPNVTILHEKGSPRYHYRFIKYLEHPGEWLEGLRRRKYRRQHPRWHTQGCGCIPRLGYRLVWAMVVMREPVSLTAERFDLPKHVVIAIVASELHALQNEVEAKR